MVACPKPPYELEPVTCDEGYHPCGSDSQDCCLDTTSHDFTWISIETGINFSYFNDVAVINENNIWAVGLIIMPDPDSSDNGTGEERFNAMHWDGINWNLLKAMPVGSYVKELQSIHAFSDNDIWFGQGGLPLHFDGNSYRLYSPLTGEHPGQPSIDCIWGTTGSDIYFAGAGGEIYRYDGSMFTKMQTNTEVEIIDISGSEASEGLFAIGDHNGSYYSNIVIELSNYEWIPLFSTDHFLPNGDDYGSVFNVEVISDTAYFATMAGLWKYNYSKSTSTLIPKIEYAEGLLFQPRELTVESSNNICIIDTKWNITHFNGHSWRLDRSVNQYYGDGDVWASAGDMYMNTLVIVGYKYSTQSGLIMVGKYGEAQF
jgi:hypothetical protein